MPDSSVDITEGSGKSIDTRTEATNGNHRQVIVVGDPSANAGVAPVDATAGLKVDLGADNDVVEASGATIATHTGNAATSLSAIDDWDESDRAKVNLIAGQAGITGGAGSVGAGTPRVTLASDDPAVVSLQIIDEAIKADDAAFTPATTKVMMAGFAYDDTSPDAVDEGDAGAARMSSRREVYTQIRDAAGNERGVNVTADNALTVDGSAVTQPVSASSLPLPTGAATATKQDTGNTSLASIDGKITAVNTGAVVVSSSALPSGAATSAKQDTVIGHLDGVEGLLTTMDADMGGIATSTASIDAKTPVLGQALAGASVPVVLPAAQITTLTPPAAITGFATSAKQDTLIGHLDGVEALLTTIDADTGNMAADASAIKTAVELIDDVVKSEDAAHVSGDKGVMPLAVRNDTRGALAGTDGDYAPMQLNASGDLRVDGSAVTQPVSAASLPLPTGAATAARQDTGNTSLATVAGAVSGSEMQVDVVTMPTTTVQATNLDIRDIDKASDDILVYGNTAKDGSGTSYVPLLDADGHSQVDVLSSALPTGAATSAKQDTIIGHVDGIEGLLTTIDGDTGNISTKIDTLAGAVSGTEMQVDVLTMPTVQVQSNSANLATQTTAAAIQAAVEVVDDWDESDRAKVNIIAGQAGVAGGAGATGATTQRVVLATDTTVPNVSGDVAHDSADSGNPVKIGGKAATSAPTPVANADRVNAWFDEYGRQVTSDYDVEVGSTIGSTGLRDRLMAQRYTVLADSLADGLAGFWTSTTANGGTTTSSGGEGLIQTSAAATGSAQITSTTSSYFPGQVGWFNSAVRFNDTGSAGNTRRIGVFTVSGTTPQDGFYYELSGTTLNAVVAKAGTPTAVASASWSRVGIAPFTLDTSYHSLEIRYTANTVWFYVDNVLRHQVSGTTASITATLNFPITIQSINASGASNRLIAVRNCGIGRFGNQAQHVDETGLSAVRATAVGGGTPHDSVDGGNPLKIGGYASSSAPSAVAVGDRVNAWFSRNGALQVEDAGGSLSVDWNGTQPVTGSGNATGALRVELPTNGTGIVGLASGTNAIGKLAANSGVDIGDVDVTSTVQPAGSGTFGSLQHTVATGTATALSGNAAKNVIIKSPLSNADDIYIGASGVTTSTGFVLSPGDTFEEKLSNTNLVYSISATASQKLHVTYST